MKTIYIITFGLFLMLTGALHAYSDAIKPPMVDSLVNSYIKIQKGLYEDDLHAATLGAKNISVTIGSMHLQEEINAEFESLTGPANAIAHATDIQSARSAFLALSLEMKSLVTEVGASESIPLYAAHCPMAFDGKGGTWLQVNTTVSNPYYGAMMLRCGKIIKQIAGKVTECPAQVKKRSGCCPAP